MSADAQECNSVKAKILIFSVICISAIIICSSVININSDYPHDIILNYADYSDGRIESLELDDYTVYNSDTKRLSAVSKEDGRIFVIAENAFDYERQTVFIIGGCGNTFYYVERNSVNGGSDIYSYNLETGKKNKLKSSNMSTNIRAFMGIENLLGIEADTNDIFSVIKFRGRYILCSKGIFDYQEMSEFISEYDYNKEYFVTDNIEKMGTAHGKLFFINSMNDFVMFDFDNISFRYICTDKVSDFYLYKNYIEVSDLQGNNAKIEYDSFI